MSPQPSRIGGSALEVSEVGDEFVFGEDVQSSLAIPKALLTQIWTEVDEGRRALSRGGLEVGGLLVGPKESLDGRVLVDGIIPLRIDYQRGPSFQMSASDLRKIPPAIDSVQEDQSKEDQTKLDPTKLEQSRAVVGFYRSRTRGDSSLRESDYEIFQAIEDAHPSFGTDFRCCFILALVSESLSLACVRMRRGGDWGEVQQFTLRSQHVQMSALPASTALEQSLRNPRPVALPIRSAVAIVPAVPEHREPEHHAAEPVGVATPRPQGTRRGGMWLLAVALAAVAAVGLAAASRWVTTRRVAAVVPVAVKQTEATRPHLGFSAAQEGGVWKLSWDRAAMDALNPVGAVLSIDEGGAEEQVPLQPSDLASGILFYTSHSSDLNFGLRVDLGGNHVEERIRVLEGPKIAQRPVYITPPVASAIPRPIANSTPGNITPAANATSAANSAPVANSKPTVNSTQAGSSNVDASFAAASVAPPAPRKFTIASKLERGGSVAPVPIAGPGLKRRGACRSRAAGDRTAHESRDWGCAPACDSARAGS